jgi:hypothetical protein
MGVRWARSYQDESEDVYVVEHGHRRRHRELCARG